MPLTKQQREELVKAYNDGLTKIDKSVSSEIQKLAENLHLSSSTIKVRRWKNETYKIDQMLKWKLSSATVNANSLLQ